MEIWNIIDFRAFSVWTNDRINWNMCVCVYRLLCQAKWFSIRELRTHGNHNTTIKDCISPAIIVIVGVLRE